MLIISRNVPQVIRPIVPNFFKLYQTFFYQFQIKVSEHKNENFLLLQKNHFWSFIWKFIISVMINTEVAGEARASGVEWKTF